MGMGIWSVYETSHWSNYYYSSPSYAGGKILKGCKVKKTKDEPDLIVKCGGPEVYVRYCNMSLRVVYLFKPTLYSVFRGAIN